MALDKPFTCIYCGKPTAQSPHHLPPIDDEPPRFMPSCCLDCSQLDPVVWDSKLLSEATADELAVIQPMPPAPDTDKMAVACDFEVRCPCGAAVRFAGGEHMAVLHEMPQCRDFKDRDALSYIRWLKDGIAAVAASERS